MPQKLVCKLLQVSDRYGPGIFAICDGYTHECLHKLMNFIFGILLASNDMLLVHYPGGTNDLHEYRSIGIKQRPSTMSR